MQIHVCSSPALEPFLSKKQKHDAGELLAGTETPNIVGQIGGVGAIRDTHGNPFRCFERSENRI